MALIQTLQDNFNDNSFDTGKWTDITTGGGSISETNQQLEFTPATSTAGSNPGIRSTSAYDLTSSVLASKMVQVPDTAHFYTTMGVDQSSGITGQNALEIGVNPSGNLYAFYVSGGGGSTITSFTYNSTNHKYWRIRESGGQIYYDYSANGKTWTTFAQVVNPITVTSVYAYAYASEDTSSSAPGKLIIDDVNLSPNGDAIDTLTDNFNDNSRDTTKWNTYASSGGSTAETNQQLEETCAATTNGSWTGFCSVNQYDLTGKQASIKVISATGGNTFFDLTSSLEQIGIADNFISIGINVGTQMLEVIKEVGGIDTVMTSTAYIAATHKYLRIRESSGTIYWDWSTNGATWTNLYSSAPIAGIPITNLYVILDDYEYDALSTPSVHKFDDFNILPSIGPFPTFFTS
jgi:hypothetical protein